MQSATETPMTTPETAPVEVTQDLAPCPNPWCKGAPNVLGFGVSSFAVSCGLCGLTGPLDGDREDAIAAWNHRLTPRQDGLREADIALLGARMVLEGKTTNATGALAKSDWKPSRAHIEGMRNTMREAIEYIDEARAALSDISPLANDTGALREALEWYGEQARLARLIHSGGDAGRHALADDGGKRARAILNNAQEATDAR